MMKKGFTPAPIGISSGYNQLVRGFTLLELVVVIIILGVLATLGFTQYGRMVERARGAEARQILGEIRKLAIAYRLANGSVAGITDADVNIGTAADQIPNPCTPSHYFYYQVSANTSDPTFVAYAVRCQSGGKTPQGPAGSMYDYLLYLSTNCATGADIWSGYPFGTKPPPY